MRIPITIAHAVDPKRTLPMTIDRYETYFRIAAELGFKSISYDQLEAWMKGRGSLPDKPIMFDFDHPEVSLYHEVWPVMRSHGFTGNVFVNTAQMEGSDPKGDSKAGDRSMTWKELARVLDAGWQVGAHTHSHPNICDLCMADPSGDKIRWEMDTCDGIIRKHLGIAPCAFAYTGETFHSLAEVEVKKRYRFARLWVTGNVYWADGRLQKVQDLVGVPGPDLPDGGPPEDARYITERSNPYRLPCMGLAYLLYDYAAFRVYLESC